MDKIVICDIDGTVADISHRLHHIKNKPKNWDAFYENCDKDKPIIEICSLVNVLYSQNYKIIFCTGRKESIRNVTEKWLLKNVFCYNELIHTYNKPDFTLLMRSNNDYRHDYIVKPELLEKERITVNDVSFILEDRSSVSKKWRELGFICVQVSEGDF